MYLRVTTTQADPAKLAALENAMGTVRDQIKKVSGLIDCYTAWTGNGHGVTIAVYESQEMAERATDQIRAVWGSIGSMLADPPSTSVYENVIDLKA